MVVEPIEIPKSPALSVSFLQLIYVSWPTYSINPWFLGFLVIDTILVRAVGASPGKYVALLSMLEATVSQSLAGIFSEKSYQSLNAWPYKQTPSATNWDVFDSWATPFSR